MFSEESMYFVSLLKFVEKLRSLMRLEKIWGLFLEKLISQGAVTVRLKYISETLTLNLLPYPAKKISHNDYNWSKNVMTS